MLQLLWTVTLTATAVLWGINHFLQLGWELRWIVAPIWIPWTIIITLGQIKLIHTYVKNRYWK